MIGGNRHMKKVSMNKEYCGYFNDCVILKNKAKEFGYDITIEQAYLIWSAYSGVRSAGWLDLPRFDTKEEAKKYYESKKMFFSEYSYDDDSDIWECIFNDKTMEYLDFDVIDEYDLDAIDKF